MSGNILDYYGNIHAGFLHARGRRATNHLLSVIKPVEGESILEIGFGTGTSLVRLASFNKQLKLYGIELSGKMLKKTTARLSFCGLASKIKLDMMETEGILPYATASMDKIYAESVLGILENNQLERMISEIYRILKPGGCICLNETIWLDTTPREKIKQINSLCREGFGIIQANEDYPYPDDWKKLLQKYHFEINRFEPIRAGSKKISLNYHIVLSAAFTLGGKLKSILNPKLRKQFRNYRQAAKNLNLHEQVMEGYLLMATKFI